MTQRRVFISPWWLKVILKCAGRDVRGGGVIRIVDDEGEHVDVVYGVAASVVCVGWAVVMLLS